MTFTRLLKLMVFMFILSVAIKNTVHRIQLSNFYGDDYTVRPWPLALNTIPLAPIGDLSARPIDEMGSAVDEMCQDFTSKRGFLTLSFVNDVPVCCALGGDDVYAVPYKEDSEAETITYWCGVWPQHDIVTHKVTSQ
ncbi:hypothetical protein AB6D11_00635 [Vibrio splendidus]